MCAEECDFILISWWKTMIKGDLVEYYKYKCKNCKHEKIIN